jgi:MraZ protein
VVKSVFQGLAAVFQGASSLNLDVKGRLSVPTRHRDALGAGSNQLTITKHPHGCLMIFPRSAWEEFRDRIAAQPMAAQWWKRIFLGNAMDVEMDSTGRVLVSPELRAGAGITRDVMLLGMGSYLQLWDASTYAAQESEAMKADMPDVFKDFSF